MIGWRASFLVAGLLLVVLAGILLARMSDLVGEEETPNFSQWTARESSFRDLDPMGLQHATKGVFVGIAQDIGDADHIAVAVLDLDNQQIAFKMFRLEERDPRLTLAAAEEEQWPHDLLAVDQFLAEVIQGRSEVRLIVELPSANLSIESSAFNLLILLSEQGYGALAFGVPGAASDGASGATPRATIQVPPVWVPRIGGANDILYLPVGLAGEYVRVALGVCVSSLRCSALGGALAARTPNLYHYLTSPGVVHSAQDVGVYLKHGPFSSGGNLVTSGGDSFSVEVTEDTLFADYDAISQAYLRRALAARERGVLADHDAFKIGLLEVCRRWKLRLYIDTPSDGLEEPSLLLRWLDSFGPDGSTEVPAGSGPYRFQLQKILEPVYDPDTLLEPWILAWVRAD